MFQCLSKNFDKIQSEQWLLIQAYGQFNWSAFELRTKLQSILISSGTRPLSNVHCCPCFLSETFFQVFVAFLWSRSAECPACVCMYLHQFLKSSCGYQQKLNLLIRYFFIFILIQLGGYRNTWIELEYPSWLCYILKRGCRARVLFVCLNILFLNYLHTSLCHLGSNSDSFTFVIKH